MIRVRCHTEGGAVVRTVKKVRIWGGTRPQAVAPTEELVANIASLRNYGPCIGRDGVLKLSAKDDALDALTGALLLAEDWRVTR